MKKLYTKTLLVFTFFIFSSSLFAQAPVFYGTTEAGGDNSQGSFGGTIFKFDPATNTETVVWSFGNTQNDGLHPQGNLVYDPVNGLFYATTEYGGFNNIPGQGTIISFDPKTNAENVVWNFGGDSDIYNPTGDLVYYPGNNLLYTDGGGFSAIYSFDPSTNTEKKVLDFGSTGIIYISSLLYDSGSGLLLGLKANATTNLDSIFSFNPITGIEKSLGSYSGNSLEYNPKNSLYYGVGYNSATGYNFITTFNTASNSEKVVLNNAPVYGALPWLAFNTANGIFYGMSSGMSSTINDGAIYQFNPQTNQGSVDWTLGNGTDGYNPWGHLVYNNTNGLLYGLTEDGGTEDGGAIISFNPVNNTEHVVWSFGSTGLTDATAPKASLIVYAPVPDITIGAISPLGYCKGATVSVPYTSLTTFNAGNIFTAQLSDSSGSFVDAVNIGTLTSTTAGTINATIPANTTGGTHYRIRVVSSSPVVTGNDNGSNITINPIPTATIEPVKDSVCLGTSAEIIYTGNALPGATYAWNFGPGTAIPGGTSMGPQLVTFPAAGTYTLTLTVSANGCTSPAGSATIVVKSIYTSTFTAPATVCGVDSNAAINYTGNGNGGATYSWNFGGGVVSSGSGQGPYSVHWPTIGAKIISLTVDSGSCASLLTSNTVQVNKVLTATFVADKDSVCLGASSMLTYTGNASGSPTFSWNLGSIISTMSGPITFTWPQAGTYRPSLLVEDSGCFSTYSIPIVVSNAPATVTATAGTAATTSQITANWNSVTGATTYFIDVSLHSSFSTFVTGFNNLNVGNVTIYNVTGLTPGTIYYYRVRANNTCGTSGNSNTITYATTNCAALVAGTVTPVSTIICPGTTQALTLSGVSGGALQWQLSTDNVAWSNVSSAGNANTYTTKTADGNTKKYYRCLSSNACYNAASTSVIVDVSSPVITVTASNITGSSVTLNWTPVGAGNYTVTYSGTGSGSQSSVTPPFTVTGLTSGSAYSFAVSQTSPAGCTALGTLTGVTTLCAEPTALKTTGVTTTSINLSWSGATANYRVYYTQLFSSSTTTKTLDVTNATTATLSSLPSGATYEIYVARKDCPTTGVIGQPCAFIYATTTRTNTCTPPVIDSVKSLCSGQLEVWLHGNASNLYTIYLQRLTPVLQAVNSYSISGKNFTISPSGAGQTYLIAASSNCSGQLSNLTIWQAGINIPAPCNALNNLLLSAPTCVGFTASWNADNCISNTLSSYTLYVRKQGAISYGSYSVLPTTTFKVINSLVPNTTYRCFVRAAYSCGTYLVYGPASATQIITTQSSGCRLDDNEVPVTEPSPQQTAENENEVFSLYPNPNTGNFIIDLSRLNTDDESVRIEVLNMLGQTVLTQLTNISNGHLNEFINMPNGTSAGMYIVRVIAGKNIYTTKVNVSR